MTPRHPRFSRRNALQAGAIGLLGFGMNHLRMLNAALVPAGARLPRGKAQACIYIFLSGGLAQHDSFDLKPEAPSEIRGEFQPIETATPGVSICQHLPLLAKRSGHWSLVRSLTHPSNDHTVGHYLMLTGRSVVSRGFPGDRNPRPTDWPSIASIAGYCVPARGDHLPPAVVLPERLVHWSGGVIPGAYAGQMGARRDPWFIEASPYGNPFWRGAYPEYTFANETWDTHGDAFPRLKDKLLPPTDKALSALLDDLLATGLLDSTLIVMAGEFGRTPRISTLPKSFHGPGRDHWGGVQTVFFAGGGVQGGTVVGASDRKGGFPARSPQWPENMAATIYDALGIPATAVWHDALDRPHAIYHGDPIAGLT